MIFHNKTAQPIEGGKHVENIYSGKFAYLSTWNQRCGIATYASHAVGQFEKGTYIILAEEDVPLLRSPDEPYVIRCWKKKNGDFTKVKEALVRHEIKLLHINIHELGVFPASELISFIKDVKDSGIKLVLQLHTTFTLSDVVEPMAKIVDLIIVPGSQNKLQMIANGADPEKIEVIFQGLQECPEKIDINAIRQKLKVPISHKVVSTIGFIQPHKGIEALIESIAYLNRRGIATKGYVIGGENKADPGSSNYLRQLQEYALGLQVSDKVEFVTGYVNDDTFKEYIAVSDVVFLNYQSQHFETSGACIEALNYNSIVATSLAPPFRNYDDAVWNVTSGFPAPLSLELLLTNQKLRAQLKTNIEKYRSEHSWKALNQKFTSLFHRIGFVPCSQESKKEVDLATMNSFRSGDVMQEKKMRILMQNRPNSYTQSGGDTVVMERTREGLIKLGHEVVVDLEIKEDPKNYDIVHLFNFTLPDYTKFLAERAYKAGVPYVVTSLYEDVPEFHSQSHVKAQLLMEYVNRNQDRDWYNRNKVDLATIPRVNHFNNEWTAKHAAGLFVSGNKEAQILNRDYGSKIKTFEIKFGCKVAPEASADLFVQEYGLKDFILCVGRIESRKNQLMLLKALEDVEIPVVIASSGFTYQPDYDHAVKTFKRKGPTLVLGRLDSKMLASAYCAAKVHALPSWYELPGIVSLEAAYYGCNVVVTRAGTAEDYLQDHAFYCNPAEEESILNAVMQAYHAPYRSELKEIVLKNTWDQLGKKSATAYREILSMNKNSTTIETKSLMTRGEGMAPTYDMDTGSTEFQDLLEKGEQATINRKTDEAMALLKKARELNPSSARALRALGALHMSISNITESLQYFEQALNVDSSDAKSYIGRGMCDVMKGNHQTAYEYFTKALSISPWELVALHQLLECAFKLDRYNDIIPALEKYLLEKRDDLEMRFCLAGCYYKSGNTFASLSQLDCILAKDSTHKGATELRNQIVSSEQVSGNNTTFSPAAQVSQGTEHKSTNIPAESMVQTREETKIVEVDTPMQAQQYSTPTLFTQSSRQLEEEVAPPSSNIAIPAQAAVVTRNIDIDMKLAELNEEKRKQNLDVVKQGCERILYKTETTQDQREFALILKAEVAIMEGNIELAVQLYTDIIKSNPKNSRALCGQAAILASTGNWAEAHQLFTIAKEVDPNSDIALAGLGMCAMSNQNPMLAWDFYIGALNINPENLRALLGVIELGYPMKRLAEVGQCIRAYLDIHPADVNFLYSLAGCYFAEERYQESLLELDKVLLFEPTNEHAIELRDLILTKIGSADRANSSI